MDYQEYTINLTTANLQTSQPLEWYKLYTFRQAFGTENLNFQEIDKLIYKMVDNRTLIQQYYKYILLEIISWKISMTLFIGLKQGIQMHLLHVIKNVSKTFCVKYQRLLLATLQNVRN